MGVAFARFAVSGPAGVRQSERAAHWLLLQPLGQFLHLADGAQPVQLIIATVEGNDARRVIAAIFQSPQTFKQNGSDVAFGDSAYDSTHDG